MEKQTLEERKPIVFISTGPGHYSKLTIEALAVLRWVDKIYCFASMVNGHYQSRTLDTLLGADKTLGQKCDIVDLPMEKNRETAMEAYKLLANQLADDWKRGTYVAVCTEGSTSVYASTRNLMLNLNTEQIPWIELPGVPSFIAAAAQAGIGLCEQDTKLLIVPGNISADEIHEHLRQGTNLVIMKLSRCKDEVQTFIRKNTDNFEYCYCENISCVGQQIVNDPQRILAMDTFPYFSILIIRTI